MYKEQEFKTYLLEENDASELTLRAYLADVKEFDQYLDKQHKVANFCTEDDIKAFLNMLVDEKRSGSTLNRKMVSIRKYYGFLRQIGDVKTNIAAKIKVPKIEEKEADFLTIEEMEKLLSLPGDDPKGVRDRALLELLYACGLKVSELTELNLQDVDLRIGFVSCRGDRAKSRIIPMGHPARKAILAYMKEARPELLGDKEDKGALFLNYNGERITRQGVWKLLKYYGQKAEISDNLSPQIIRNSFAAHLIINGADLKSVQELLGTEDLSTTKLFLKLSKNRVMDVYDKAHPRA